MRFRRTLSISKSLPSLAFLGICAGAIVTASLGQSCSSGGSGTGGTTSVSSTTTGFGGFGGFGGATSSTTTGGGGGGATTSSTTTSSGSGGSSTTTSSSSVTTAGSGGGTTTSGTGGTTASSSSSSSGDAGTDAGGEDAGDAGGPTGVLVMVAGGGTQIFAGEFHPGAGWTTATLTDATDFAPAVTLTSATSAVGLIGSTSNSGELRSLTWTPGHWTAPTAVAAGVTTRAAPSIAAYAGTANAVFQGTDFKHYFAAYVSAWNPTAEPVGGTASQSFGPSPATIAAIGAGAVIAFAGNDGDLYDQTRSGGTWATADAHGLGDDVTISPTVVALTSGPDLMIVFPRVSDSRILYTTRTAGVWSAPAVTDTNALTAAPVSVAALPNGAAVMAYQGTDGNVYWSSYTPGATTPWTTPAALATPNFATPGTPAVAAGVGGTDAEMVFVDGATGQAKHARLTGTSWSAPVVIGGVALTNAAASSLPE